MQIDILIFFIWTFKNGHDFHVSVLGHNVRIFHNRIYRIILLSIRLIFTIKNDWNDGATIHVPARIMLVCFLSSRMETWKMTWTRLRIKFSHRKKFPSIFYIDHHHYHQHVCAKKIAGFTPKNSTDHHLLDHSQNRYFYLVQINVTKTIIIIILCFFWAFSLQVNDIC